MAVSQIFKSNNLIVEIYINDNKDLFSLLEEDKDEVENVIGYSLEWNEEFNWLVDIMPKMKRAFRKYL